ncbi:MAG: stage II sporulation protein P [Sporolactobacillus sp.]
MKKFQPHLSRSNWQKLIVKYIFLLIVAYALIVVIAASQLRLSSIDNALQKNTLPAATLLTETFGNENVLFNHVIKEKDRPRSMSHFLLESLTDLRFDDIRSLFGSELPGFTIYNTKIFYAGKGLNYNNLPQDSPPPAEIKLQAPKPAAPNKKQQAQTKANNKLKKVVFIYHTHSWESYLPALKEKQNGAVSADPAKDVIFDGQVVGDTLVSKGIGYLQDTSNKNEELRKRGWNYNQAYQYSRIVMQQAIKKNPSLNYFIDIHRDSSGRHLTTAAIGQKSFARISIIIGEANPNYSANLFMAKQVKDTLDKRYPGLVRGIVGKTRNDGNGVYNQDLSKYAILVEIGGIDNTLDEVERSSKALGEALAVFVKQQSRQ